MEFTHKDVLYSWANEKHLYEIENILTNDCATLQSHDFDDA